MDDIDNFHSGVSSQILEQRELTAGHEYLRFFQFDGVLHLSKFAAIIHFSVPILHNTMSRSTISFKRSFCASSFSIPIRNP